MLRVHQLHQQKSLSERIPLTLNYLQKVRLRADAVSNRIGPRQKLGIDC